MWLSSLNHPQIISEANYDVRTIFQAITLFWSRKLSQRVIFQLTSSHNFQLGCFYGSAIKKILLSRTKSQERNFFLKRKIGGGEKKNSENLFQQGFSSFQICNFFATLRFFATECLLYFKAHLPFQLFAHICLETFFHYS